MLKLHAGVSKKVGLPGFSIASTSCTIEAELDSSLLQDREGFQTVVQRAYQSCEKAVGNQIAWVDVPVSSAHCCNPYITSHTSWSDFPYALPSLP
jgi:hypothetical protein